LICTDLAVTEQLYEYTEHRVIKNNFMAPSDPSLRGTGERYLKKKKYVQNIKVFLYTYKF